MLLLLQLDEELGADTANDCEVDDGGVELLLTDTVAEEELPLVSIEVPTPKFTLVFCSSRICSRMK